MRDAKFDGARIKVGRDTTLVGTLITSRRHPLRQMQNNRVDEAIRVANQCSKTTAPAELKQLEKEYKDSFSFLPPVGPSTLSLTLPLLKAVVLRIQFHC